MVTFNDPVAVFLSLKARLDKYPDKRVFCSCLLPRKNPQIVMVMLFTRNILEGVDSKFDEMLDIFFMDKMIFKSPHKILPLSSSIFVICFTVFFPGNIFKVMTEQSC